MIRSSIPAGEKRSGFTLAELMMAVAISSIVLAGAFAVYISGQKIWHTTTLEIDTSSEASDAIQKIVYGIGAQGGIRGSLRNSVNVTSSSNGWTISYVLPDGPTNYYEYNHSAGTLRHSHSMAGGQWYTIAKGITSASAVDTGAGLRLSVCQARQNGQFSASNTMSTFVAYRNKYVYSGGMWVEQ